MTAGVFAGARAEVTLDITAGVFAGVTADETTGMTADVTTGATAGVAAGVTTQGTGPSGGRESGESCTFSREKADNYIGATL